MNRTVFAVLSSTALVACAEPTEVPSDPGATPTYHADVRPILERHCTGCHQDGQIGQGSLTSYDDVAHVAGVVREQVETRTMPPWLASGDCNDYQDDPSLSDAEIATIGAWIDGGLLEGDPASAPPPPAAPAGMTRVDRSLAMAGDYMPAAASDDYRCFVLDWAEEETRFVTGFGVRAGNASIVHHVIAYYVPPDLGASFEELDASEEGAGYTCYGGPGGPLDGRTSFMGAWAPGMQAGDYPAGTGIRVDPGSKVILQMHYNTAGWDGAPDRSAVDLMLESSVEREARFQFFTNPEWVFSQKMVIPAGAPDASHEVVLKLSDLAGSGDYDVYGVALHMHTRGTSTTVALQPDADASQEQCLLDIPRWDFGWQRAYELTQPVRVDENDSLRLACHWDNSAQNQPQVAGMPMTPQELNWGEGTNDEMCLGMLYLTDAK